MFVLGCSGVAQAIPKFEPYRIEYYISPNPVPRPLCRRAWASPYIQAFRTEEAVDIVEDGSGYTVGWNRANEYMRYTVEVEYAGMQSANAPHRLIQEFMLLNTRLPRCSNHRIYGIRFRERRAISDI